MFKGAGEGGGILYHSPLDKVPEQGDIRSTRGGAAKNTNERCVE
jgi:hypothetical protein